MTKLKIIAACGNGMGTSMIIKLKLEKIIRDLALDAEVEALSMGQSKALTNSVDFIICSVHLVSEFNPHQRAKIIGVKNLMDENEIRSAFQKALTAI